MTNTSSETIVAPLSDIPPGEGRTFEVAGERIAVFRTRHAGVFAVEANCPHKGAPLADGLVGGATLICPLHSWKFDLGSGAALMGECGLKTYAARVDAEGRVVVAIPRQRGEEGEDGGPREGRTPTPLRIPEPKSGASANSAIGPRFENSVLA